MKIGRPSVVSPSTKLSIRILRGIGLSGRKIGRRLKLSEATVRRVIQAQKDRV